MSEGVSNFVLIRIPVIWRFLIFNAPIFQNSEKTEQLDLSFWHVRYQLNYGSRTTEWVIGFIVKIWFLLLEKKVATVFGRQR